MTSYRHSICFAIEVMTIIDKSSKMPLYAQIYESLRVAIASGKWLPREPLPPENELVGIFKVSRITIRRAVDELVAQGLVVKEKGRGTFVAPPKHSYRFTTLTSFTEELINKGFRPGTKILDFSEIPAPAEVAGQLRVAPGEPIFRLERQRFADGNVVALNLSHLPRRLCPGLGAEDVADHSLYKVLEKRYSLFIKKASRDFETVPAGSYEAPLLEVEIGTPILRLNGTVSTEDDTVVDFCIEHYK